MTSSLDADIGSVNRAEHSELGDLKSRTRSLKAWTAREACVTTSRDGREVIGDCICEDVAVTVAKLHNLTRLLFGNAPLSARI